MPKPKGDQAKGTVSDLAYAGAGSADLTNWSREVGVLQRQGDDVVRENVALVPGAGWVNLSDSLLQFGNNGYSKPATAMVILRETINRATGLAIALVFMGVVVIASGSLGQVRLLGDGFALLNATSIAAYYVVLRTTGGRNMLAHVAIGNALCGIIALAFADFVPLTTGQIGLVLLSGAVILPGAMGLLMLGPRYLPAPEVSMITLLEVVLGPLLVWAVIGEHPGQTTLMGGAVIITVVAAHTLRRILRHDA
jgi:drug/metabolite transporter (DMT)-like permease